METLDELIEEAKACLYKLCPGETHGEDYDAERLDNILTQIKEKNFKQLN